MLINIRWKSAGRKATQPPNPLYPNGIVINENSPVPACKAVPTYPAPECGLWLLQCQNCGATMAVTAAGRIDDPKVIYINCKTKQTH